MQSWIIEGKVLDSENICKCCGYDKLYKHDILYILDLLEKGVIKDIVVGDDIFGVIDKKNKFILLYNCFKCSSRKLMFLEAFS